MKLLDANKVRWLAGMTIGVVIAETLRDGWAGVIMLSTGLLGRWLLGKIASTFFDDEINLLKRKLFSKDPVKQQIWHHTHNHHGGRFKNCRRPECFIS